MGFQLGICFVILICFKNGMALSMKESEKVAKTCKDLLQPKKLYEPTGSKIIVDFRDSYDYLKLPFYSNGIFFWDALDSNDFNDHRSDFFNFGDDSDPDSDFTNPPTDFNSKRLKRLAQVDYEDYIENPPSYDYANLEARRVKKLKWILTAMEESFEAEKQAELLEIVKQRDCQKLDTWIGHFIETKRQSHELGEVQLVLPNSGRMISSLEWIFQFFLVIIVGWVFF